MPNQSKIWRSLGRVWSFSGQKIQLAESPNCIREIQKYPIFTNFARFGDKSEPWADPTLPNPARPQAEAIPELESMQDSLLVLQGLGLTEAELAALLKTFPEALACHPEDQLQKNLTRLREEYKLTVGPITNLNFRRKNPKLALTEP